MSGCDPGACAGERGAGRGGGMGACERVLWVDVGRGGRLVGGARDGGGDYTVVGGGEANASRRKVDPLRAFYSGEVRLIAACNGRTIQDLGLQIFQRAHIELLGAVAVRYSCLVDAVSPANLLSIFLQTI